MSTKRGSYASLYPKEKKMTFHLIEGDPMNPASTDLLVQLDTLDNSDPVPDPGWQVLTGNNMFSKIGRLVYRYQVQHEMDLQVTCPACETEFDVEIET